MGLHHQARRALRHQEPEFWEQADGVDALVIGGGDLLHPGTTVVQHEGAVARIENWSFVEAGLLGEVRPVAWNALGVPFDIPPDLAPALRAACAPVALLTVRDEGSRRRLEAAGVDQAIEVVPDTAVLIDDVITEAERLTALDSLRGRGEIPPSGPLLVAHASFTSPVVLAELAGALRAVRGASPGPARRAAPDRARPRRRLDAARGGRAARPPILAGVRPLGGGDLRGPRRRHDRRVDQLPRHVDRIGLRGAVPAVRGLRAPTRQARGPR